MAPRNRVALPSIVDALDDIEAWYVHIHDFWAEGAPGWAPIEATRALTLGRLDRLASLASCLSFWLEQPEKKRREGSVILAWANLGALVEGAMAFLLSVHAHSYLHHATGSKPAPRICDLRFEDLRRVFRDHVYIAGEAKTWDPWLANIQTWRNAIHSFKDRDVGAHAELVKSVIRLHGFLQFVDGRTPYPEGRSPVFGEHARGLRRWIDARRPRTLA